MAMDTFYDRNTEMICGYADLILFDITQSLELQRITKIIENDGKIITYE